MKKLKTLVLGIGLTGGAILGVTLFATSQAEGSEPSVKCEWNGDHCKNPQKTNYCGCE